MASGGRKEGGGEASRVPALRTGVAARIRAANGGGGSAAEAHTSPRAAATTTGRRWGAGEFAVFVLCVGESVI